VIEKESTLATKSSKLLDRETQASWSSVLVSAMLRERMKLQFPDSYLSQLIRYSHVLLAARRLVDLDDRQVNAVATRIELDLRIGYAFTRFITGSLRTLRGPMEKMVISYGEYLHP
jgi:hypothetical protein